MIVRYQGGNNAGHTIVVNGENKVFHLLPSGSCNEDVRLFLGSDVVIDPEVLYKEIQELADVGVSLGIYECNSVYSSRLMISKLAHIILSIHKQLDNLRESVAKGKGKIGTTGRGIGPAYEARAGRVGIRFETLLHPERFHGAVKKLLNRYRPEIVALGGDPPTVRMLVKELWTARENLACFVGNISPAVSTAIDRRVNVLGEGAQGVELDIAHGTYPYVTSSSTMSGAFCSGAGVGPKSVDEVIGVIKAYTTRVGGGPFPSEIQHIFTAEALREAGHEYGATTGRPRRVGYLDIPQLRHAARVHGLTGWALTKGDVLRGMEVKVCTHYLYKGRKVKDIDELDTLELEQAKPCYKILGVFNEEMLECKDYGSLPSVISKLIEVVWKETGVPVRIISTGPKPEDTIFIGGIIW